MFSTCSGIFQLERYFLMYKFNKVINTLHQVYWQIQFQKYCSQIGKIWEYCLFFITVGCTIVLAVVLAIPVTMIVMGMYPETAKLFHSFTLLLLQTWLELIILAHPSTKCLMGWRNLIEIYAIHFLSKGSELRIFNTILYLT